MYRPFLKLLTRHHFEMRHVFTTVLLFDLWIAVSFASAGILDSFFLGLHSVSSPTAINGQQQQQHHLPMSQSTVGEQTGIPNATGYWNTNSSSISLPTADGGQLRVDLCEGDIVVPLSFDVKKEIVIKSTDFPFKRSTPLICSWNVKATTNCRRGLITMTINERSRLADVEGCLNGYYTVSPFMEEAKICGRVNTVPAFHWYVEHEQPENVTISLRHIGLNDGYSEGFSFNLSGDCLPNRDDTTISKAWQSYGNWLQQLSTAQLRGRPTVVLPSAALSATQPSFSNDSTLSQNANNEEFVTMTTVSPTDISTTSSKSQMKLSTTPNPISHTINTKAQNQTNVSNQSSTVDLPRQNVTSPIHPPVNSSEVLLLATLSTQQSGHDPHNHNDPMDVKVSEDQGEIPWLILKSPGQSLSKTHPTPRPRPSFTTPGEIVIQADILPPTIHTADKVQHTDSEIPWLILKTDSYSSMKKPLYQPDPIQVDSNPIYDDDESRDSLDPHPDMSLYSSTNSETHEAYFLAESSQIYSSHLGGYDVDDHGQQVDIREDKNTIPWLILKSPNHHQPFLSNHHLSNAQNTLTYVRPVYNISRAPLPISQSPIIRSNIQHSSTKETVVNYDHVPTNIVPKSQDQQGNLSYNGRVDTATKWMHSGLNEPRTSMDPQRYASSANSPTPASTTNPPRNHLPIPLRRNPLLAFDD